jgi:hypothetical protein
LLKRWDRTGSCFQYCSIKFPALSKAEVKEGIFDGSQIQKLTKDATFSNAVNDVERQAWKAFIEFAKKFVGNVKILIIKRLSKICWRS